MLTMNAKKKRVLALLYENKRNFLALRANGRIPVGRSSWTRSKILILGGKIFFLTKSTYLVYGGYVSSQYLNHPRYSGISGIVASCPVVSMGSIK